MSPGGSVLVSPDTIQILPHPESAVVFPDPPNGGNEPDDRAERDAACGEEEPQTSGAKVAGSMAPQTRCLRVTEQSEIERTGAESRGADDEKKVLKVSHGVTSLHRQIHHGRPQGTSLIPIS